MNDDPESELIGKALQAAGQLIEISQKGDSVCASLESLAFFGIVRDYAYGIRQAARRMSGFREQTTTGGSS